MKSSFTKLAIAAVLLLAAIVPIMFLNKTTPPAYALDQTLQAIKSTRIVHMLCRDWQGNDIEIWMKLNPETRYGDYMFIDYPLHDMLVLSTPDISYQYAKSKGIFVVEHKQAMNFNMRIDTIFEDLAESIAKMELNPNEKIEISKEYDPNNNKELLVFDVRSDTDIKIYIDPDSKLPVRMHIIRANSFGTFIRDFDEIYFDEEPPAGIFDFKIPEDATVINKDESEERDDPNTGIVMDSLSRQQAAEILAENFWRAIIKDDFEELQKSYYVPETKIEKVKEVFAKYFNPRPTEFIRIGELADQYGCTIGQVLPCILRHQDGTVKQYKLIIKFRSIDGTESVAVDGLYGMPQDVNE